MHLVDIMSHSGLASWPTLALVLFLVTFLVIVIAVFRPSNHKSMDAASRLPFDDEPAGQREEDTRS